MGRIDDLRDQHPGKPWLWKKQWTGDGIPDQSGSTMFSAWIFTVLWNAVAIPVGIAGFYQATTRHKTAAWIALLFPAFGLLAFIAAIRLTLRRRKFGMSVLKLDSFPASPGAILSGVVYVPTTLRSTNGLKVRLSSFRRITEHVTKHSSTSERVLWEDDQSAEAKTTRGVPGTEIHLRFVLPADAATTDENNPDDQLIWRLEVKGPPGPGMDYSAQFEVPVFVVPGRGVTTNAMDPSAQSLALDPSPGPSLTSARQASHCEDPLAKPTEPGITATRRIDGGWDFYFAARRNKSTAATWSLILLIMGGATVFLSYSGVSSLRSLSGRSSSVGSVVDVLFGIIPLAMAVVFFGVSLLLLLIVVGLWFEKSFITVSRGTLSVRRTASFSRSRTPIGAADLKDIVIEITANTNNRAFYSIKVQPKSSTAFEVASGIGNKRDAQWIADRMKESLGLRQPVTELI